MTLNLSEFSMLYLALACPTLVVFLCMAFLQWRVIRALDDALTRSQPLVLQPRPVAVPSIPAMPAASTPPILPKFAPAPAPIVQKASGPFDSAPIWFQWALHEIGTHEDPGNRGAAVRRYINLSHCGTEGDPWCAIFANAGLETCNIPGTGSPSSQSFRSNAHFVQLAGPALGAIVVFWRGSKASGLGHVGYYRGENDKAIWVLGGNENDMVQIEALPKDSTAFGLVGYYWPKSQPLPIVGAIVMSAGAPTHVQTPLGEGTPQTTAPARKGLQTNIVATFFGGPKSAYGSAIDDNKPGVALPYHFPGNRPQVRVTNRRNNKSVVCEVVDVGPWNINDPYWEHDARPQAESGIDASSGHRKTNMAGIDLTLAAITYLQIDGKGLVDWEFVSPPSVV